MNATLLIWESLCLALVWSVFCRFVPSNTTTKLDVRLGLWVVGVAGLAGMCVPLYGWVPDLITLLIVGAVVVMQTVTAQHWRNGVPQQFIKDEHRPRRRVGDTPT